MMPNKFVHTINGITYDIVELQQMYEELKQFRRPTGLYLAGRNSNNRVESDPDKTLQSQIKKENNHVLDPSKPGFDVANHPAVRKIIDQFAIKINDNLVDINCFRPGFAFTPHTDQVKCTVMIPIIPTNTGAPIDFYYVESIEVTEATEYRNIVTEKDRVLEHHYSNKHPTIINQRQIHGVRKLDHERVYLRLKLFDYDFDQLVELDKQGKLVKS